MSRRATRRVAAATLCFAALLAVPAAAGAVDARVPVPPQLAVRSAALYAPATDQFLYADDLSRESAIASTTKLMTALIVLQHVRRLGTVFTQPDFRPAPGDSQIGLDPGDRMTVHDLVIAMMLPSADDAAYDLAYNVGHGSVPRFVAMMNTEARQLGLRHTHYSTPIGLDTPGNYSTAGDLVRLAEYDLAHEPFFRRVVALPDARLRTGPAPYVVNLNDLVRDVPWVDGVKTGHTNDAGYVLVASGHRDGMTLISAVLGTSSEAERDATSLVLLDYGFDQFGQRTPVRAGELEARPTVKDSPGRRAVVRAARTFTRIFARGAAVRVQVRAPRQLTGPLPAQTVVGSATVLDDGHPVARIPLVLAQALPAVSGLTLAARFVTRPLMLVIELCVLLAAAGLASAARRRRRRRRRPRRKLEAA